MKNILVTGGNGQLGKSFQKIAGEYPDYRFIFTDLPATDINDREAMEDRISNFRVNLIVNCAAYTRVDAAEEEPKEALRANAHGPATLSAVARDYGIGLIHISTDFVFGQESRLRPFTEQDRPGPVNVYGETKLAGEKAIEASGCDAAVIRTSWLYSEFGNNFIKTMLDLSRRQEGIEVVDDRIGSPTYATDLARAVMTVAERGVAGYELYHYCNEGVASWYEFAKEAFSLARLPVAIAPISQRNYRSEARRPEYTVLDTSKIRELGAIIPRWQDSLRDCLVELGEIKNEK